MIFNIIYMKVFFGFEFRAVIFNAGAVMYLQVYFVQVFVIYRIVFMHDKKRRSMVQSCRISRFLRQHIK